MSAVSESEQVLCDNKKFAGLGVACDDNDHQEEEEEVPVASYNHFLFFYLK